MTQIQAPRTETDERQRRIEQAYAFTQAYLAGDALHPALREAACLRAQFPVSLQPLHPDDVFAGCRTSSLVGMVFSIAEGEIGYYCCTEAIHRELNRDDLDARSRQMLRDVLACWSGRTTLDIFLARQAKRPLAAEMRNALLFPGEGKNWQQELFAASFMPRMAEINLDFDTLLTVGLPGLRARITAVAADLPPGGEAEIYQAMLMVLELCADVARDYADQARALAAHALDPARCADLQEMAAALSAISCRAPESLREAMQLCWLYGVLAGIDNFGRMDIYLGDFLAGDLAGGRLDEEAAFRLVEEMWRSIGTIHSGSGRVIIGGRGRRNAEHADRFALLALKASRTVRLNAPQLSLRCYRGMNPALYDDALDVIGDGRTYPLLYNDDVYVPAVSEAFGIPQADAEQYIMSNCGEINIDHRALNSPNGSLSYIKLLEYTLNNGLDPVSGQPAGVATGDFTRFRTFNELWDAYRRQISAMLEVVTDRMVDIHATMVSEAPHLFAAILFDDCIARGAGIFTGARYLGLDVESHTLISAADSLTAIKRAVFADGSITPADLLTMLQDNFAGFEKEHRLLLNTPKFGNDDADADEMAVALGAMVSELTRAQATRLGMDFCLPSHVSVDAYLYLGKFTGATPDGRLAGQPVSNGFNPLPGRDHSGVTAVLNSMARLSPAQTSGQVHHLKLARTVFDDRPLVKSLLDAYFANGGCYLCLAVMDRAELEDALVHPDAHANLMVRIGGYSAPFISLQRELQEEMIARTLF